MKIHAGFHPFEKVRETMTSAPDTLSARLSSEGLPEGASHIRFSRGGRLLFWTDNFPVFLRESLPMEALEAFLGEMANWIVPPDRSTIEKFRFMLGTEPRGGIGFGVRRQGIYPPGHAGLFYQKVENGWHCVLLGPVEEPLSPDMILGSRFFSGESGIQGAIEEWLVKMDNQLLENVALDVLQEGLPDTLLSGIDVHPVHSTAAASGSSDAPGSEHLASPADLPLARWWGTVDEKTQTGKHYTIHSTIRCGRVLPVVAVSADIRAVGTFGMSEYRKILSRMASKTLDAARAFSWSPRYRYVEGWREPEGYDTRWAGEILGHLVRESEEVSLLPVTATKQDLPKILRKTRPDEPYFWIPSREQVWIALRGTGVEKARAMVVPSIGARMSLCVGPPVSLEAFARMIADDLKGSSGSPSG
ncbi:MAG: hypothetical protein ACYCRD_08685 [Leptospirillum sp.]